MRRTAKLRWVATAAAVGLLTAACGGGGGEESDGDPEERGAPGGSFATNGAEPEAFAPTSACYSSDCSQIIDLVWTSLLAIDPETAEQELKMAESIESEDGQTWTIKLKDGFTFHNGEPVNAESYLRAWNHAAYGPNATQVGFFFNKVEGYEDVAPEEGEPTAETMSGLTAPDDLTIQVELAEPFSQFPMVLSYTPASAPMAEACLSDLKACNEQPIGNGPYQFKEAWKHNRSISLEKYQEYSDEETAGLADEIQYKIYGDLKAAFRDFEGGELDVVNEVDPSQIPQARAKYGDSIVEVDDGNYNYIGFPLYEEAYSDVRIRQALSMAIDREEIIDRVLHGTAAPATDVLPPFVPGSRDDACDHCVHDPEQAKTLYDEAGGVPNDQVTIWFNNDGGHEDWVEAVIQQWEETLGVTVSTRSMPFTPYLGALDTRSKINGPYRLGWLPDYPSPENYLDPLYGAGSTNYGDWKGEKHQEFLDLVAEGNQAASVEEGLDSYQVAADVVLDEVIIIPTWFGQTFILTSDSVENVNYSPVNQLLLAEVSVNQ